MRVARNSTVRRVRRNTVRTRSDRVSGVGTTLPAEARRAIDLLDMRSTSVRTRYASRRRRWPTSFRSRGARRCLGEPAQMVRQRLDPLSQERDLHFGRSQYRHRASQSRTRRRPFWPGQTASHSSITSVRSVPIVSDDPLERPGGRWFHRGASGSPGRLAEPKLRSSRRRETSSTVIVSAIQIALPVEEVRLHHDVAIGVEDAGGQTLTRAPGRPFTTPA